MGHETLPCPMSCCAMPFSGESMPLGIQRSLCGYKMDLRHKPSVQALHELWRKAGVPGHF